MNVIIHKEIIENTDIRLKRHVNHDSRSKNFAFDTSALKLTSVRHIRNIPILDQGQVGACTGNAGIGVLGTSPHTIAVDNAIFPLNETGALELYSAAETLDGDGPYPPKDNGSSGLSIARVLKAKGLISGYQHNFTLQDTLLALTQYPLLIGTNWHNDMFTPSADGEVVPTGPIEGGHEYEADELDVENGRVWFDNSWNESWGIKGRFWMTWANLNVLLMASGDSTVLFPANVTPPTPVPAPVGKVRTLRLTNPYMTGDDVKALQIVIGAKSDGVFGPGTKSLVETYQHAHGLRADGICGPVTWAVINGN